MRFTCKNAAPGSPLFLGEMSTERWTEGLSFLFLRLSPPPPSDDEDPS